MIATVVLVALTVGLAQGGNGAQLFDELGEALEWIEDQWITQAQIPRSQEAPPELRDMELFAGRKPEPLTDLLASMQMRSCSAGERVFARGEGGDEIYLIRCGIVLPLDGAHGRHLASFGRSSFFGEMAFLDHQPRSADAVAFTDCDLYVLSRQRFDVLFEHHKLPGLNLMEALARLLAARLRHTHAELNALQSS